MRRKKMPRPPCCRRVSGRPAASVFKPVDAAGCEAAEEVLITLDEFEAIRLSDFEGLYQEQAAECMNVSRATFGRVLDSAHRKLARMLLSGASLRIEGGPVCTAERMQACCRFCTATLQKVPSGPVSCLACRGAGFASEGAADCPRRAECPDRYCWRYGKRFSEPDGQADGSSCSTTGEPARTKKNPGKQKAVKIDSIQNKTADGGP
jgi:uncharacterized protein